MTVTLKSKKKCPGVYLIVAKAVSFAASAALSYLTTVHAAILIRAQLEYDRGREYTDFGHAFILAISHAHRYAYTSAVHSACGYTASDIHFANYSIDPCSLQSCQVQVVNYAPRGMSLLETSSFLKKSIWLTWPGDWSVSQESTSQHSHGGQYQWQIYKWSTHIVNLIGLSLYSALHPRLEQWSMLFLCTSPTPYCDSAR